MGRNLSLAIVFAMILLAPLENSYACEWRVTLTDRETQEVKNYVPHPNPVELNLVKRGVNVRCIAFPPAEVPGSIGKYRGVRLMCRYQDGQIVESVSVVSTSDPTDQQPISIGFTTTTAVQASIATPAANGQHPSHQVYGLEVKCE